MVLYKVEYVIHRWMGAWNINLTSEVKERSLAKELVGDNIEAELMPFTFAIDRGGGGEEVLKKPMAYVPNLIEKVIQLLDQNDE